MALVSIYRWISTHWNKTEIISHSTSRNPSDHALAGKILIQLKQIVSNIKRFYRKCFQKYNGIKLEVSNLNSVVRNCAELKISQLRANKIHLRLKFYSESQIYEYIFRIKCRGKKEFNILIAFLHILGLLIYLK